MNHARWARRAAVTLAAAGAATLGITSFASGAGGSAPDRVVVKAKGSGQNMRFALSDDSIQAGGNLVIKDANTAPHTLSLVQKALVPRTKKQISKCDDKGHICSEIGKWHKFNPKTGQPKINPVDVGKPGWNKQGNLTRTGDSVIFDPRNPAPTRPVSAEAGTSLHFICAIHPWMHGVLHVK